MRGSGCVVVLAVTIAAAACARGDGGAAVEASDTAANAAGDGGSGCADACGPGDLCSAGACVPATTDRDGDGVAVADDCDDRDPRVYPGAREVCNGKDDDCNRLIDEPFDLDRDGHASCEAMGRRRDCDDADPATYPGAVELCNGKDDDCNGAVDDGYDADNDGYYVCQRGTVPADCNDLDANVHVGVTESCNGKDDDCNGGVDDVPALLIPSTNAPVDRHWATAGSAYIKPDGWVILTEDTFDAAGALWWNATYLFDAFDVSASFFLQNKGDGADGLAFVWARGSDVTRVGERGSAYGAKSLGGYAVVIDTYPNPGEPPAPFLLLFDAQTGFHLARTTIPNVRDGLPHRLRVRLDAGKVSVWLDGINTVFDFPLPGYVPFTGVWGFTAATGVAHAEHGVRDIAMTFPRGQGCVP